jgi:hypothetical protein
MKLEHLHSGLAGFIDRQQLASYQPLQPRVDGAIVLSIDGQNRVYCRPAPHGDLVLECRLAELPSKAVEAEEMIRHCLLASWVRMYQYADVPVLDSTGTYILVQQRIPSDATTDEFSEVLEGFVNSLSDWRKIFRVL